MRPLHLSAALLTFPQGFLIQSDRRAWGGSGGSSFNRQTLFDNMTNTVGATNTPDFLRKETFGGGGGAAGGGGGKGPRELRKKKEKVKDKSAFFQQMLGVPAWPSFPRSFILSPTQQPCHAFYNKPRLPLEIRFPCTHDALQIYVGICEVMQQSAIGCRQSLSVLHQSGTAEYNTVKFMI